MPGDRNGYGKTGVTGAIARKGNLVCRVIGDHDAPTLAAFVRNVIDDQVTLVATDENQAYDYLDRGVPHQAVKHSAGEYVRGNVHTTTTSKASGRS